MKILITGIGITGKSTLRRLLKKFFPETIDIDGDYDKFPEKFDEQSLYVIEDVHATMQECCLPLGSYDCIIYLLPGLVSHFLFWLKRVWVWFKIGQGSWDKNRQGWLGSGKTYDPRNIPLFLRLMFRDFRNRGRWITEDIEALFPFKNQVIVVKSSFSKGEIKFSFTHKF